MKIQKMLLTYAATLDARGFTKEAAYLDKVADEITGLPALFDPDFGEVGQSYLDKVRGIHDSRLRIEEARSRFSPEEQAKYTFQPEDVEERSPGDERKNVQRRSPKSSQNARIVQETLNLYEKRMRDYYNKTGGKLPDTISSGEASRQINFLRSHATPLAIDGIIGKATLKKAKDLLGLVYKRDYKTVAQLMNAVITKFEELDAATRSMLQKTDKDHFQPLPGGVPKAQLPNEVGVAGR